MAIKTIPYSHLETALRDTLNQCADSGEAIVVELPDRRLVAIQAVASAEEDVVDDLLQNNADFQALVRKSLASSTRPFVPQT